MIIGIDPHKASHTATAVDPTTNTPVASLRIDASIAGYRQLIVWADKFPQRRPGQTMALDHPNAPSDTRLPRRLGLGLTDRAPTIDPR